MNRAPPRIFSRTASAAKWARARARQRHPEAARYISETIADDLIDRFAFMRLEPQSALVVGDTDSRIQSALNQRGTKGSPAMLGEFDEELPCPSGEFDLIVHLLGLGMVNDLPGALIHARNALSDGGLFVAAFPGAGSLPKLRQIALVADDDRPAARIHPQVDNRAGTALLERAGFTRQVVDSYPITVRFSSLDRMLSDLRDHGLTASLASPAPALNRSWLARAQQAFDDLREDDGKVSETFEILVLTGWR